MNLNPASACGGAGHLLRAAPDTVRLADHEGLLVPAAVGVGADGRAVTAQRARHRRDPGAAASVQDRSTGHLLRGTPDTVRLADHERLAMPAALGVATAAQSPARQHDTEVTAAFYGVMVVMPNRIGTGCVVS